MPLIIICGTPVSGKTTRAHELKAFFEEKYRKNVQIVSEDETIVKLGFEKNTIYLDFQKEKRVRGYLKSEVMKLISNDNVIILDGSNYIKGYRYELYCASKAVHCTQCTIYTIKNHEEAWMDNEKRAEVEVQTKTEQGEQGEQASGDAIDLDTCNNVRYTEEVFNALTKQRFEEPNSNNRWDSPLFTVLPPASLDYSAIYNALFQRKAPPPNMSTQNMPLSATNFLYELDRVTQAISKQILNAKQLNLEGRINFPGYADCPLEAGLAQLVTPQRLLVLRRQFLTYTKVQYSNEETAKIGRYYIQYLNKTLTE